MLRRIPRLLALFALASCAGEGEAQPQPKPVATDHDPAPAPAPAAAPDPGPVPLVAAPRAEHDVFHLGPNRHLAHRVVDGDLVVDGGSPGFARYTKLPRTSWRLLRKVDGEPVAQHDKGAGLELPLTAEQAAAARTLRLRVYARSEGGMNVKVDGTKVARVHLASGWQDLAVPATGWREGENQVVLESSIGAGLHVRWLSVSRRDAAEPIATPPLSRAGWNAAIRAFHFSDDAGLAWYLDIPEGAALVADVAGACTVEVAAADGDGHRATGRLAGKGARVDLSPLAGKIARVELTGKDCESGGLLLGARITLPGAAAPPPPDGAPPKYIVLWVMDTLRADYMPTFRPGARAETPVLDKLAETGAVFRQHYVGGNESQVSHASMFTGLYPAVHTVRTAGNDIRYTLPTKVPILGKLMKAAGYTAIAVTGNGFVGNSGGYNRGFAEYRNMMQERGARNAAIPGADILAGLIEKLEKHHASGPVFAFLGTIDSHSPLRARAPWLERYSPGPYDGPFQDATDADVLGIYRGKMGCHKVPPRREIERMRAIYDSTISYQDALIGDLLAELERLGIADETMLIITADHGEELFEERRCGHGATLRESLAWVPLLVHYPPRIAARIVEEGSEGVDVLPTILDAIGAETPPEVQGRSLRGLAAGDGAGWTQPSFASQYEYAFAVRLGQWKARFLKRGLPIIIDLASDPDERENLVSKRPLERRYLTDHMGLYLHHRTRWKKAAWGVTTNMTEAGAAALETR